jgi:hypothetical protein
MTEDRYFRLSVEVPAGIHSHEENFARTQDLIERLALIHPLLSEISIAEGGSGWKRMIKQPLFKEISLDHWVKSFNRGLLYGDPNWHDLEASLVFWNRHSAKHENFMMSGIYNRTTEYRGGNFFVTKPIVPALIQPDIMDAMMLAFIEAFDGYCAFCNCIERIENADQSELHKLWLQEGKSFIKTKQTTLRSNAYQLWLKEGQPYPNTGETTRMHKDHTPPTLSESWHGGTRYMWPEYEPRSFLGLDKLPDA